MEYECPYCGCDDVLIVYEYDEDERNVSLYVKCLDCGNAWGFGPDWPPLWADWQPLKVGE